MSVLIPRPRTLGVRLSEDEYLSFEKFCVDSGARSMADVARTAICTAMKQADQQSGVLAALNAHSAQVRELEWKLEQLTAEIALVKLRNLQR